ncbi:hypothetical protein IQ249_14605 [Lusitaniella coriacea LEGE 07157]|uniref:Uncharacterized protein n=1 Tax=Lusitaniella coriacea LEGE 07157 TaxID=945747 RepID=A0A8J7DXG4_9CYAN|nr:hypothetical protein [Lusitaniella coriacea]MBE9117129.1 hypothetical protein [Lusitaniella coriacea LEGE 07157]
MNWTILRQKLRNLRFIAPRSRIFDFSQQHPVDFIYFIFLGFAALKLMFAIETVADIQLHDETYYLYSGVNLLQEGLPEPEWAPFYTIWYYFLSSLEPNPIQLHFLNHQLLVSLTTLVFYLFLRSIKVRPILAFLTSSLYLVSGIHQVDPRPTNFAFLIFALVFLLAIKARAKDSYYGILSLGFLLISFIRPEYFVPFCAIFSFYFFHFIKTIWIAKRASLRAIAKISFLTLTSLLFITILGNPLGGDRSWWAFRQHFSVNWVEWNQSDLIPWTNYVEIVKSVFGNAENISEALSVNPTLFFAHILTNFKNYIINSIEILFVDFDRYQFFPILNRAIACLEVIVLIAVIFYIIKQRKIVAKNLDPSLTKKLVIAVLGLLIAIIPSVLLVYPREHYLVIQGTLIFAIAAYLLESSLPKHRLNYRTLKFACAIGLIFLLLVPNLSRGWCIFPNACIAPRNPNTPLIAPNLKTIQFLKSLNIKDPVNLLEAEGGFHIYLGDNYNRVGEYLKYDRFSEFAQKRQINAIILSHDLVKHHKFINDEDFNELMQKPEAFGYSLLIIPRTEFQLLLKQRLLMNSFEFSP